jgi:hypothetical protein
MKFISWQMGARQHDDAETDVRVPIVRVVPVTRGAAHVPVIIVERTAAQHTGALEPAPPCKWQGAKGKKIPPYFCNVQLAICACPLLLATCLLLPAAEQTADLGHHCRNMLILAIGEPIPTLRETQVQPNFC